MRPKPKPWHEIYPYGTKEGDEEAKLFRALSRNKSVFRSVSQLVKSTGLSREKVEEWIDKYARQANPPLLYPHETNDDHWAYWERCQELLRLDDRNLAEKDRDNRVQRHLKGITPASD